MTAPPARDSDIVVTGVRASNQKAVRIKRASDQIIDTVSASEIGRLPDFNAGILGRDTSALAAVDLRLFHPFMKHLRHAADLLSDRDQC